MLFRGCFFVNKYVQQGNGQIRAKLSLQKFHFGLCLTKYRNYSLSWAMGVALGTSLMGPYMDAFEVQAERLEEI